MVEIKLHNTGIKHKPSRGKVILIGGAIALGIAGIAGLTADYSTSRTYEITKPFIGYTTNGTGGQLSANIDGRNYDIPGSHEQGTLKEGKKYAFTIRHPILFPDEVISAKSPDSSIESLAR